MLDRPQRVFAMARKRRSTICFIILLQAPAIPVAAPPNAPEGLFVPPAAGAELDGSGPSLEAESRWLIPEGRGSEPAPDGDLRSRKVRVDLARLATVRDEVSLGNDAHLRLNLFDDVDLRAVIERFTETRYGYSLSGRIDGDPHGTVTLVVHGDILAGAVHSRQGNFVVTSRNGTVHAVRQVSGDFKCGVGDHLHSADARTGAQGASAAASSDGDDGSEVDLLVLFTEAALDAEGGLRRMRASIDLAVAWANDVYDASGVNMRLNLVGAVQTEYLESRAYGNAVAANRLVDLNRLVDPADGFMDEAAVLRDRYAADIVHLIISQTSGGGVAELLQPHADDPAAFGFSVSSSVAPVGSFPPDLLAHEIGHVMGLLHDRYDQRGASRILDLPPYIYGYVNQRAFENGEPESRWRTIMATDFRCRDEGFYCRRLPRFSNPDQRYPDEAGDPLGVPGEERTDALDGPADAVRGLNEHRSLVAGFRQSASRCDYGLSEERREISASGGAFSVEVDADGDCEWTATARGGFLSVESDATGSGAGRASYRVEANEGPARVGYVTVAGETLSVYQSGAVAPASVCDRTPEVRDAIASAVGRECAAVSEFDLLEVTELDLAQRRIEALDDGDLTGLVKLNELSLRSNPIGSIPAGIFRDLRNLRELNLVNTGLTDVPDAIAGLSSLQLLDLGHNGIERIHRDSFRGLSQLDSLRLHGNRIAALPDSFLADMTHLDSLYLFGNRIADLRKEAWAGPSDLRELYLSENPLRSLRPDAFASVPTLTTLGLRATQLEALSPRTFAGLDVLNWLVLSDNRIADLSGVVFPGSRMSRLELANNAIRTIPSGLFAGFTSSACAKLQMILDLSGNPGAPFPLMLELARVDAGRATAGPASVIVRIREGAPWPIAVRVVATGDSSFTREVTVVNGETESEPFEVAGEDLARVRLAAAPRVPGSYQGVRIALGDDLRLFALDDRELGVGGGPVSIDLDEAFGKEGVSLTYSAVSSADAVATVSVANGRLRVEPRQTGTIAVTVTATDADGTETVRSFDVRVVARSMAVPYMPPAADDRRQGFVRVINHSGKAGEVRIQAIDDDGTVYGPVTMSVTANGTHHFNSEDLERGNAGKGLSGGVGPGQGGWRLELDSDLDIEVLSYIRTADGFLTAMHDVAPEKDGVHRVAIFNPGSNLDQVSVVRLVNPGNAEATVTIRGIDGDGVTPGSDVEVSVPAGAARTLSAADLEEGDGVTGALGDGAGKWQLSVSSDAPVRAMSLLESPGGHVTNLSTVPASDGDRWAVPLFPPASDELGRQGFVRVINHGETSAHVTVSAFDESDRAYDPLTLTVGGRKTVHFNSDDLELGNEGKGLSGGTGAGTGDWRLELTGGPDVEVLSYIRTRDGFLTSMHEVVAGVSNRGRVVTFNPGRNVNQVSRLRLINAGGNAASVRIRAVDDQGRRAVEPVRALLSAHSARSYTAAELEAGASGLEGALGKGAGKWRFTVESDRPITVMSLLESPTGHLSNLSTAPEGG